ncbi:MAG: glycosyltransferase family 39 protein, partial [Thiotrichales bacterium]
MGQVLQRILDRVTNTGPRTHTLLLLVIIVLGFVLRLYSLYAGQGYREFAVGDELEAFKVALELLAGVDYAWYIGHPNFAGGHAPGPWWTLFWILVFKLGGYSFDGAMFVMLLLNTFVIYLVYRLANIFVGRDYALLTALLYATGPWPVYYSTGLWNPVPMAFFGAILFLALWDVVQRDDSRSIFLVCLVAAVTPQFHMISVFYYPAILLILYLSPARLNRQWFIYGIIAGIALYLPYFIGEMNNDWENSRAILAGGSQMSFGVVKII